MLRISGLLVAASIAGLLSIVGISRPPLQRGPGAPGQIVATAEVSGEASGPRPVAQRPVAQRPIPRLPELSSQPDEADGPDRPDDPDELGGELDDPTGELESSGELDEPNDGLDPEPEGPPDLTDSPPPDYLPTADDEALARRALGFLDEFASAIASNAESCDRMAEALELLFSKNRDFIADAESLDAQADRRRWLEKQIEARAWAMIGQIAEPLQRCTNSEHLRSVIESGLG